jgi:hypothetical protein
MGISQVLDRSFFSVDTPFAGFGAIKLLGGNESVAQGCTIALPLYSRELSMRLKSGPFRTSGLKLPQGYDLLPVSNETPNVLIGRK